MNVSAAKLAVYAVTKGNSSRRYVIDSSDIKSLTIDVESILKGAVKLHNGCEARQGQFQS